MTSAHKRAWRLLQGAYLLRAIHKFLNLRGQSRGPATPAPASSATNQDGASQLAAHARLGNKALSSAEGGALGGPGGPARVIPPPSVRSARGLQDAHSSKGRGAAGAAALAMGGWRLTAYAMASTVALAQELLPLVQIAMARAETNPSPSPSACSLLHSEVLLPLLLPPPFLLLLLLLWLLLVLPLLLLLLLLGLLCGCVRTCALGCAPDYVRTQHAASRSSR